MKPLVPSTPGEVSFVVRRERGLITTPKHFAKFSSVREEVNGLLRDWDTEDNHVVQVEIHYTFPVERQWTRSPRKRSSR